MTDGGLVARSRQALQDEFLRAAVRFTTDRLKGRKRAASDQLGHWEAWREQARAIREHTIQHLDYYLSQFAQRVRERGGQVHFARDGEEAAGIIERIVAEQSARRVVKSKSMVSEEIHINARLAQRGVEVVETDLGEFIIQLAGEMPSHIIMPCIHKNRQQIRELFVRDGADPSLGTDTQELLAYARRRLREKFLTADVGMTGCNFAIAETGSIVLFTNEGNGRMVSSLPRTHIVTMGMERILPTFADLEVMANLLPRSATGQKLTAYMSVITGPRRPGEVDGPEELHVVIIDNGRSKPLGDPEFQPILHCIRCGACLNVCPVYRHIGGHAYGSVYPGPIGAVLSPLLWDDPTYAELPYASSLCGACDEACPVKIPLHDMLVALRRRNVERGWVKAGERSAFRAFAWAFARPGRYRIAMRTARRGQVLVRRGDVIRSRLGPLAGWTVSRDFPALARESFRERYARLKNRGEV
ncbi:MAG: iron-sulfur cluster-binding protein [Thermoflavifilum sp.]|nr:iron-sulfur cluster-binding protein [Thermoflavifilum sp.]MCL6513710.1 iron-sulfur cluster-binding protein [Alicyclobacillus sp.]